VIRVVDYGLGNVQAFLTLYKRLGIEAAAARTVPELANADHIILPGVGAFDHAMDLLTASGMKDQLATMVKQGIPVLGVCVGMQILAAASDEGQGPGLSWVPGKVRSFKSNPKAAHLPLPHMGWNDVRPSGNSPLFASLQVDARFYFLHSYYFECEDPAHVAATAHYGARYACAVSAGHVHGVQFHPEKSHHFGMQLLKNFAEL
jgi:glutamine amidotransferase